MPVRRPSLLVGVALLLALFVSLLLRDTPGYVVRREDGSFAGDITHYIYWTRLVTLGGVQDAYAGAWPETFAVYPPVTLYSYQALGNLYRATQNPTFDLQAALQDPWLSAGIKLTAVAWHLATAVGVYAVGRRLARQMTAAVAAALYALNPAALYGAAHWGQPDGAHGLFSVLAVGWLATGLPLAAWAAMALAALAKPQAWAILPLLSIATLRSGGARLLVRGGVVAAGVAGVLLLPFLLTGRLSQFLELPRTIATVMPAVTANAHNVWWLFFASRGLDPLFSDDNLRFIGPLTFRGVAALLVLAQFGFSYWLYWTRRASLPEAAALGALGWFLFTTQAHENHLMFALPLLALAWPSRPRLLIPYVVLTATVLLNMALHDILVLERLGLPPSAQGVEGPVGLLRSLNALVNVACFVVWAAWATLRPPLRAAAQAPVPGKPLPVTTVRLGG